MLIIHTHCLGSIHGDFHWSEACEQHVNVMQVFIYKKALFTHAIFAAQLNIIFVASELQVQYGGYNKLNFQRDIAGESNCLKLDATLAQQKLH